MTRGYAFYSSTRIAYYVYIVASGHGDSYLIPKYLYIYIYIYIYSIVCSANGNYGLGYLHYSNSVIMQVNHSAYFSGCDGQSPTMQVHLCQM
jgi:hypothetical protein